MSNPLGCCQVIHGLRRAVSPQAQDLLRDQSPTAVSEFSIKMTRTSRVSDLRQLQRNAENMARLSPFKADRDRFGRIAERYREEADTLERDSKNPAR